MIPRFGLILFCLFSAALPCLASAAPSLSGTDSLAQAVSGCEGFNAKLKAYPDIKSGVAQVPADWANPASQAKVPVFWWKRAGKDSSYPPLAFIHGGPASNSWALLDKW